MPIYYIFKNNRLDKLVSKDKIIANAGRVPAHAALQSPSEMRYASPNSLRTAETIPHSPKPKKNPTFPLSSPKPKKHEKAPKTPPPPSPLRILPPASPASRRTIQGQ